VIKEMNVAVKCCFMLACSSELHVKFVYLLKAV